MIMIKDNHIDFCGGISQAIKRTKQYLKDNDLILDIVVETRNLDEINEVINEGGITRILLDNFDYKQTQQAVNFINNRFETESSGGITENNILEYKEYNENNQIIFHLNYLNGKRDGYCVSGKYIFFYKNDKKVCVLINEEKTYDKCCVCYYETKTQTLCEHYICKNCIQKLIDSSLLNTCPLCRKSFIKNDENNT